MDPGNEKFHLAKSLFLHSSLDIMGWISLLFLSFLPDILMIILDK